MIRDYEVVIMNEVENKIIKTNKDYAYNSIFQSK